MSGDPIFRLAATRTTRAGGHGEEEAAGQRCRHERRRMRGRQAGREEASGADSSTRTGAAGRKGGRDRR